ELRRFVIHDAAVDARVEDFTRGAASVKILCAAAADAQRRLARACVADSLGELMDHVLHDQNRGSSGNFSAPVCTCMRPNSAQRLKVGTAFPALSSPRSSNARFTP